MRVHDFRGEVTLQDLPLSEARTESQKIRSENGGRAGVVLIFMFDATEAIDMASSDRSDEYYTNKLFGNISLALRGAEIFVRRVIIVYNKFDQLESARPGENHGALLARCESTFQRAIEKIRDTFRRHDVRTVATVLSTNDEDINTKNASIVLGYAADGFVDEVLKRLESESVGHLHQDPVRILKDEPTSTADTPESEDQEARNA
ncbi:hypothetical protein Acsp07_09510 [Actinomycetospora sp. NBRC 106378]|nr:hypothetical protein Acsp07_09510 [Actinomycetospora sp. NBRC 106378]